MLTYILLLLVLTLFSLISLQWLSTFLILFFIVGVSLVSTITEYKNVYEKTI